MVWEIGVGVVGLLFFLDVEKNCRNLEVCLIGIIENGLNNFVLFFGFCGFGKILVIE